MSIATESRVQPEVIADDDQPYPLTADQFMSMIEAGVFPREARVYLRDGRIYEEMAKTNAHGILGSMIMTALVRRLQGWSVFPESEFKMDAWNTRLPDIAVVRGDDPRAFLALGRRPEPSEIGLAVEIAVTSLAKDLGPNLRRYAKAMIPTYWVADFKGRRLLAHTGPRIIGDLADYEHVEVVTAGGTVALVLDGQEVARFAYEDLMP